MTGETDVLEYLGSYPLYGTPQDSEVPQRERTRKRERERTRNYKVLRSRSYPTRTQLLARAARHPRS